MNGESPLLLFTPCGDTYFEAASHEKNEPFQGMGLKWEGIKIGYIYSKFPVESGEWKEWFNGHSSKVLKNEETGTYSFRFSWAENRNMLIRQLVRLGKIAVRVHPGMVLPENMDMLLKLETKNNIDNIDIPGYFETVNIGDNKYKFRFKDTGIKKVTIRYDKNKWTNLIFFVTDKIDTLIKKRAGFIVKNQQYNNRKDGRPLHRGRAQTGRSYSGYRWSLHNSVNTGNRSQNRGKQRQSAPYDKNCTEFLRPESR